MELSYNINKKKITGVIKIAIKIIITVVCLIYISHKINFDKTKQALSQANIYWLVAALFAFVLSKIISSYRLNFYFKNIGIQLPEKINLKLYWLGMFYNLFLPGSISGDAYKVVRLSKEFKTPYKQTTFAVLFDRISGLLALFILCACFWVYLFKTHVLTIPIICGAILAFPAFYILLKFKFSEFIPSFFQTISLGMAVQILQVVSFACILFALQLQNNFSIYLLIFLISSVVAVLPFTIGGLGAREMVFLWGAKIFAMDISASVIASVLFYFITVIVSFLGLYYIFKNPLKNLQK